MLQLHLFIDVTIAAAVGISLWIASSIATSVFIWVLTTVFTVVKPGVTRFEYVANQHDSNTTVCNHIAFPVAADRIGSLEEDPLARTDEERDDDHDLEAGVRLGGVRRIKQTTVVFYRFAVLTLLRCLSIYITMTVLRMPPYLLAAPLTAVAYASVTKGKNKWFDSIFSGLIIWFTGLVVIGDVIDQVFDNKQVCGRVTHISLIEVTVIDMAAEVATLLENQKKDGDYLGPNPVWASARPHAPIIGTNGTSKAHAKTTSTRVSSFAKIHRVPSNMFTDRVISLFVATDVGVTDTQVGNRRVVRR
jgi:hypothetical protein